MSLRGDEKVLMRDLGKAALEKGQEIRRQHDYLVSQIQDEIDSMDLHIRTLEVLNSTYNGAAKRSNVVVSGNSARQEKASQIALTLKQLAESSKDPFRNQTRISLEKVSNTLYLSLIDPNEGHARLIVDDGFRVRVQKHNEKFALLTPGQRALATYCVLEGLSIVSQLDFPLIVDSPGQGIDKEYMGAIFERLLSESQRQVILSPTTAEVDIDSSPDDFGFGLSVIFHLTKPNSSTVTAISELHRREK